MTSLVTYPTGARVLVAGDVMFAVSGTGDTVMATLGVMLAGGTSLQEAVKWANKAAGIVVGKLGAAVVHPHELFP